MLAHVLALALLAASPDPLEPLAPLLGTWVAEAQPDGGTGSFTFEKKLDGRVIVRRNTADYPAAGGRPAAHHEDLLVVYAEGGRPRADYFDNEGHVIRYAVTVEGARAVFLSDAVPGAPRFRLTYDWSGAGGVEILFEIAPPGKPDAFQRYLSGKAHRT